MNFLPGEPVPPGFEEDEESPRPATVLKQIDNYNSAPLLGTEYTVELQEAGQPRPDYYCVLCQTCNDSRSIFVHWTSQAHRAKYLQTHFQKAYDVIQKLKRMPNSAPILVQATSKLVQLIENHFGRSRQLRTAGGEEFRRFRAKICSQVNDYFHFDECAGPDFVAEAQLVLQDLKLDEGIKINLKMTEADLKRIVNTDNNTIALDAISSDDESFGASTTIHESGKKPQRKKNLADDQSANGRGANRSPPAPGGTGPKIHSLPTPKELSIQASHIAQERYKWEKFRCMLEIQLKQLRDETDTYETNPEKHPDYPDEWKQFWNRRYKQLQEEKKCDPNLYDYKPEWISYWKDRRIELFNISVNKIKKDLKEKFKLGDEDEEKTKELMETYKIRVARSREPSVQEKATIRRKANFRNNNRTSNAGGGGGVTVIDISDDDNDPPGRNRPDSYRRSRSRSKSAKRSVGRRPVRRSRSRSSRRNFRRGSRSRSNSRDARSRRSRTPSYYHRQQRRDRYDGGRPSSRERGDSTHSRDYGRHSRSIERERSSEFYRSEPYARPSRYDRVETFRVMDSRVYPEYSQGLPKIRSISPTVSATNSKSNSKDDAPESVEEGPLTVVSVLRMLSAVEEHLGSLGPKATNLLSKALAMEMVQPNAADDLLLNDDNCVFLETTKEKLKGILIAEVLDDPQKVRVVKKVITNIAAIIFQVTSRGISDPSDGQHKANAAPLPIQLPFERNLVAPKLANALVLKGYYDVSTEDMTKLLHLFTLMAKTDHQRRQGDINSNLSFPEVCTMLGLKDSEVGPEAENMAIDLDELMKEVENQLHKESMDVVSGPGGATSVKANEPTSVGSGSNAMESLTDSDLQTLLQNFKFLSSEEQVHLIGHLRKLEVMEPARVQRLRKYVNLAELSADGESCSDFLSRVVKKSTIGSGSSSNSSIGGILSKPIEKTAMGQAIATVTGGQASTSSKANIGGSGVIPSMEALSTLTSRRRSAERDLNNLPINKQRNMRNSPGFLIDDDDDDEDDDYNFDDLVMKACDSNGGGAGGAGKKNTPPIIPVESSPNALTFKPAVPSPKLSIKDTESIIADLMGTLGKGGGAGGSGSSGSAGIRGNDFMLNQQQQHQQAAMSNPPNPNRNRSAGPYQNPGYPGISAQQQQQPRQIMTNVTSGPDPIHQYPYGGGGPAGYHPYAGNNYPGAMGAGVAPGHIPYGGGGMGGGQINPWANNGSSQLPYNQIPQNYLNQQQQQPHAPHYNSMFGGRH
ncbi:hypothetical protein KR032_003224 [Drosophila birchii]|nr:hypothetical protein KR032_003224 [Drosophila birchii]